MAKQAGSNSFAPLPVGSVVGILGGGQLGRMMAIAANRLGFITAVLSPRPEDPAASVAHHHICKAFDDKAGLHCTAFGNQINRISYKGSAAMMR